MIFITTLLKNTLTYEVKSEDVYEECFKHNHLFDFSNFSKTQSFYHSHYEMVVGKKKVVNKEI